MSITPTVVLVHGAFSESAMWSEVIRSLSYHAIPSISARNELRGLASDARVVASMLAVVDGPVVLVGHAYGGAVISNATRDRDGVEALVFVAGPALHAGESFSALVPWSESNALEAVPLMDGGSDLYLRSQLYRRRMCGDLPADISMLLAATQRPIRDSALTDLSGEPAWARLPSWCIIPEADRLIPAEVHRQMAERVRPIETVEVLRASHSVALSHPGVVAETIRAAVDQVRSG